MNFFKKAKNKLLSKTDLDDQLQKSINSLGDSFAKKLDLVLADRKNNPENSLLTQDQIQEVIKNYTQKNMAIAAASAAAPGPLGIAAMVFEVTAVIGNQIKMTYDIACAYDKEELINRDLLIDIPLHAMGIETNLDQIQNLTPDELKESIEDQIKKKTTELAKNIVTKSAKKSLVKFIPIAGSVLMAIWTKSNTKKVSNAAIYFFDNKKTLKVEKKNTTKTDSLLLEKLHLQTLLNLIKADSINSPEEIEFITPMIENSNLDNPTKSDLIEDLKTDHIYSVDYQSFKNEEDEKEALINDLIILYNRDKNLHQNEIKLIHDIGNQLGFEKNYIDELLVV